jgi:hypothetical protein
LTKQINLTGVFPADTNKGFRLGTRLYHIIHRNTEVKQYPIIINNFNRLHWLQQQVEWLLRTGQKNIHIIDNNSTYPPLLAYYKKVPATVYRLQHNTGHEALWRSHIFKRLGKYYYVYTDPDVLPDENTPNDYMAYFKSILDRQPNIKKVGFGLRINDLPDYYPKKNEVIQWESQFYHEQVEPGIYKAKIDTTFALYRPGAAFQCWEETLRTGAPYTLRHMPWYEDPEHLSEESKYYMKSASDASSWYKAVSGENLQYRK